MQPSIQNSATETHEPFTNDNSGTTSIDGISRRTVLKATAVAVGTLAASTPAIASGDDENGEDHEEDVDELTRQLREVRAGTRPYWADVARAREDGYDDVVSPFDPGMGFHFINTELVAENEAAEVNLSEPAVLVYLPVEGYDAGVGDEHDPDRDDELVLAAVEFLHAGTEGADANLFADEDANPPPRTLEEEGWHFVEEADVTALHVWVPHWNPVGVFHPTNPAVENQPGVEHHF